MIQGGASTDDDWGIVIQARLGSTRLPRKMLAEVSGGRSLLDVVLGRLGEQFGASRLVLATTIDSIDDGLMGVAASRGVAVHRGSVANVLERFLGAAALRGWSKLVRVCADNPFLLPGAIEPLVDVGRSTGADYVGYRFGDGTWSILSHGGLFAEYVTCDALREVARVAEDPAAFEHVTNYVYTHPERFRTASIPVPLESVIANWRLTVDTQADLDVVRAVASGAEGAFPNTIEEIAAIVDRHPALVESMQASIARNRK
jgi:spore coat polysaccharide biosynthesis protein SpsF (cytidylyltransferase family)